MKRYFIRVGAMIVSGMILFTGIENPSYAASPNVNTADVLEEDASRDMESKYSFDDVVIMEDVMQLYYYNDIIEDLQVYNNDLGYIDFVIGSISDVKVDSYDKALLALQGVKKLMGMDNVREELCPENIFSDDYGYVYTFRQVYKGLPVYGSTVSVSTDLEGNTMGLNSYYVPIELDTTPSLTSEAAMRSSTINYKKVIRAELNVYVDNDIASLAWNVSFKDSDGQVRNALVDANNADVLSETTGYIEDTSKESQKNVTGNEQTLNTVSDCTVSTHALSEYLENISLYRVQSICYFLPIVLCIFFL